MKDYILYTVNLALFDGEPVINTTTSEGLTQEMKTYYSDYLIDMAQTKLFAAIQNNVKRDVQEIGKVINDALEDIAKLQDSSFAHVP